jgi:lipid A ethanolaminephosphotransferase
LLQHLILAPITVARAADRWLARHRISPETLNIAASALLVLAYNRTFLTRASDMLPTTVSLLAFVGAAFGLILAMTSLLSGFYAVRLQKLIIAAIFLLSAATSFFTDRFGVLFDEEMIRNIILTGSQDANDVMTPAFLTHLALYGGLPAAMIWRLRVRPRRLVTSALGWVLTTLLGLLVCAGLIFSHYSTYASFRRPQRDQVLLALQPFAALTATFSLGRLSLEPEMAAPAPIALDARRGPRLASARPPLFLVMVVGETARAANHSLGGYARDTNPELSKRDVIYFPQTTSCGTSTAVSVPCIFSMLPSSEFTVSSTRRYENVLDVVQRLGFQVHWLENNDEDYQTGARVQFLDFAEAGLSDGCPRGQCDDSITLGALNDLLSTATTDTLVVIHLVGSHLSYHERYPEGFEHFSPVCKTTDLTACSPEMLVNGYDNSIRFTDHVLSSMIDSLANRPDLAAALLYTSDHGESLGEDGIYVHSTPVLIAPKEQREVPLLLWLSSSYSTAAGLDLACLRARAAQPASHDNLFHTLLGMTGIETTTRDPALDLTEACLQPTSP